MIIDRDVIRDVLGLRSPDFQCAHFGMVTAELPGTIAFVDDARFVGTAASNGNLGAIFVTPELEPGLADAAAVRIVCDDPRYYFFTLWEHAARADYVRWPSRIDPTAVIHPRAHVAEHNVVIGPGVVIEPNVTILPDVEIGAECIIRAGAVLGAEGFEHKRTSRGIVSLFHTGRAILGERIVVGANCGISKGVTHRETIIGDDCKFDNLVHVAHGVQIGRRCLFAASAMIAGSVTIGDDVWVGPGASISSQVRVADGGSVTIGSVVTRDVAAGEKVTGNFAVPHARFLSFLRTIR